MAAKTKITYTATFTCRFVGHRRATECNKTDIGLLLNYVNSACNGTTLVTISQGQLQKRNESKSDQNAVDPKGRKIMSLNIFEQPAHAEVRGDKSRDQTDQ